MISGPRFVSCSLPRNLQTPVASVHARAPSSGPSLQSAFFQHSFPTLCFFAFYFPVSFQSFLLPVPFDSLPRPRQTTPYKRKRSYGGSTCTNRASAFPPPRASSPNENFSGTFYDILGISPDDSQYSVKSAFRQLARKYHPDVLPSHTDREESTRRFLLIKEAYEVLSDPSTRAVYDYELRNPGRSHWERQGHPFHATKRQPWLHRQNRPLWTTAEEKEQVLQSWRVQWTNQLSGLRNRKGSKPNSWASNLKNSKENDDVGTPHSE